MVRNLICPNQNNFGRKWHSSRTSTLIEMRITKFILTVSLAFLFASCNIVVDKEKNKIINDTILIAKDTNILKPDDSRVKTENTSPGQFLFQYSECKNDCNDYERIISKTYKGDSIILRIGSIQNCTGKFRLETKSSGDSLDLIIKIKGEIRKRKNGTIDTLIMVADCECYYYFDIGLRNIPGKYKTILIDGHKFGRKQKGLGEIIVLPAEKLD